MSWRHSTFLWGHILLHFFPILKQTSELKPVLFEKQVNFVDPKWQPKYKSWTWKDSSDQYTRRQHLGWIQRCSLLWQCPTLHPLHREQPGPWGSGRHRPCRRSRSRRSCRSRRGSTGQYGWSSGWHHLWKKFRHWTFFITLFWSHQWLDTNPCPLGYELVVLQLANHSICILLMRIIETPMRKSFDTKCFKLFYD